MDHRISPDHDTLVLLDQLPVLAPERRRLAGNDDMRSMLFCLLQVPEPVVFSVLVGVPRKLAIQRHAGCGGEIQRWRMLRCVIAEADGEQLLAVRDRKVQARRLKLLRCDDLLLHVEHHRDSSLQRMLDLSERMRVLPRLRALVLLQTREEQRSEVLRVRGALDDVQRLLRERVHDEPLDLSKVRDDAVVHERPSPERKWMAVVVRNRSLATRRTYVGKDGERLGACADGLEDRVRQGLPNDLVFYGARSFAFSVVCADSVIPELRVSECPSKAAKSQECGNAPCNTEPIRVEQPVAHRDLCFRGFMVLVWLIVNELRQIMLADLLRKRVCRADEDVLE